MTGVVGYLNIDIQLIVHHAGRSYLDGCGFVLQQLARLGDLFIKAGYSGTGLDPKYIAVVTQQLQYMGVAADHAVGGKG